MRVLLASSSPRRRELLQLVGYEFEVAPSPADEAAVRREACQSDGDYVLQKALLKGRAVARKHPGDVVLACDTAVACNGRVYEKPRDEDELLGFLRDFSDNVQVVYTALAVFAPGAAPGEPYATHVEATEVRFGPIPEDEARAYARTREPYDKAGGYAMQGQAAGWITRISGDYYTVVGFPLSRVCQVLRKLGVERKFR